MKIFITGVAGFIGFHVAKRFLENGDQVLGIDNLNNYYDINLKKSRLNEINKLSKGIVSNFEFFACNLEDKNTIKKLFKRFKPNKVINLAAQAGVRYSTENPNLFLETNILGFGNILEECRNNEIEHLVYASSSSVYGGNQKIPFSENDSVDHPVSIYAATKRSNELMAHTYSHLFNLASTGLRFFTVYGPWGRPDMALFSFTNSIIKKEPIKIFNNGYMVRDFTYIDDIVTSLVKLSDKKATPDEHFDSKFPNPSTSWAPHRIFNIGNSESIKLMEYIECLENELGEKAFKSFLPMQKGDVKATESECLKLEEWIGYKPKTSIEYGIKKFVEWYKKYYKVEDY
tara:strand:- start:285 stop:1316 length:1032 start_codon:yes stop_codon:yes gene_type:complete